MAGQIEFERDVQKIRIVVDDNAVWIVCGWTLPIPRRKAIDYANHYATNDDPNEGFFPMDGGFVCFTHNGGKITFSQSEAQSLLNLIKSNYL